MDNSEVPDTAQHFIECDTCRDYSKFYCNTCHMRMCEPCKENHLDVKHHRQHEVVVYQERRKELPVENCDVHPKKIKDLYCNDCQLPICSLCFVSDHNGHEVTDFEFVYAEIVNAVQKKLSKLENVDFCQSEKRLSIQRQNLEKLKTGFANLRLSMKESADAISAEVNALLASNYAKLDKMEKSALDDMKNQEVKTELCVKNLRELINSYNSKLSSSSPTELIVLNKDLSTVELDMLPDIVEPIIPVFTRGKVNKDEISRQFGELSNEKTITDKESSIPSKKMKESEMEETDTSIPSFSNTSKADDAQNINGCFTVKKIKKINNLGISNICHISPLSQGKFWLSDDNGNLIECDKKRNTLRIIHTGGGETGYHAVNLEGELLYADKARKAIYKVTSDTCSSRLISTSDWIPWLFWTPIAISSSLDNDILVGMNRANEWKIARYSKEGEKLHEIQRDDKGGDLYKSITYITENINGDICASDLTGKKVVVVKTSRQFRFSYSGHHSQPGFSPYGICTDNLGHILVCNSFTSHISDAKCFSVHLLDKDGHFLSSLLTPNQSPSDHYAISVDDQQNMLVGSRGSSTLTVYKYLS